MAGIAKLEGLVNGSLIIFMKGSGGKWAAAVPSNIRGEYVVELSAYDEAGNMAYSTKYLFAVDLSSLKVVLKPLNYAAEAYDNFGAAITAPVYAYFYNQDENYRAAIKPLNYGVGKVKIA